MPNSDTNPFELLSLEDAQRVDGICVRFEQAWKAGENPSLDDYLTEADSEAVRNAMLWGLLRVELEYRRSNSVQPSSEEYLDRFPEKTELVESAFHEVFRRHQADSKPDKAPPDAENQPTDAEPNMATVDYKPGDFAAAETPHRHSVYVPGYEILEKLGQGGMGVVYKARHIELDRIVALKMIRAGEFATAEMVKRFIDEAQAVAKLHHPNIVQIYDIGSYHDLPYFSLEYADTGSLSSQLTGTPIPEREAARLMVTLATAIHAAHENGIIHRDLKPANVLLSTASGQWTVEEATTITEQASADAPSPAGSSSTSAGSSSSAVWPLCHVIPKITDFGLAKLMESESGLTSEGQILGTPSYMAPEQAQGNHKLIGPATDVYGLGAILYEMLTGRPPFRAKTKIETLRQVVDGDAVQLRMINRDISKDMETICMQCLHKEPERRYKSAMDLAIDLNRFMKIEPIQARPVSLVERYARWCRRNPIIAALTLGLFLVLIAGTITSSYFAIQSNARAIAEAKAKKDAQWLQYRSQIALAHRELLNGNYQIAGQLLDETPPHYRNWEYDYLNNLHENIKPKDLLHTHQVWHLALSPGGKQLATGTTGGVLTVWDWKKQREIWKIDKAHDGTIWKVAYSPDGHWLATAGEDRKVCLWDAGNLTLAHVFKNESGPEEEAWAVKFSRDANHLATGWGQNDRNGGHVVLWPIPADKSLLKKELNPSAILPHSYGVWSVDFSPDGKYLATASGAFQRERIAGKPGEVRVWDLEAQRWIHVYRDHMDACTCVAFSPSGERLASCGYDKRTIIRDFPPLNDALMLGPRAAGIGAFWPGNRPIFLAATLFPDATQRILRGHTDQRLGSLAFSPDGKLLASGSWDKTAKLWDVDSGKLIRSFLGHQGFVGGLAFSHDRRYLFTGSAGERKSGVVHVWDWDLGRHEYVSIRGRRGGVRSLAFRPGKSATVAAAAGAGGVIEIMDMQNFIVLQTFNTDKSKNRPINCLAFNTKGKYLAGGDEGGVLTLWKAETGKVIHHFKERPLPVQTVCFSPDGEYLAAGYGSRLDFDRPGEIRVYRVAGRKLTHQFGHSNSVFTVEFISDGRYLLGGSATYMKAERRFSGEVKIWDLNNADNKKGITLAPNHSAKVLCSAYNSQRELFATAGADQTIRIWTAANHKLVQTLKGHTGTVNGVAFSRDGKRIVSASDDHTVKVWSVERGDELFSLEAPNGEFVSVAFSPDGLWLAAVNSDGTVRVWQGLQD